MKKRKNTRIIKTKKREMQLSLFIAAGIGILGGIVFGMFIQQMIFIASAVGVAEGLEGTTFNIEVDINETKLIEGIKEGFREEIAPIINQTLQENKCTNDSIGIRNC